MRVETATAARQVVDKPLVTMAARYQHVTTAIQRDIAARVGGLIWQASENN